MTPEAIIEALSVRPPEVPAAVLRAAADQRAAVTGPLLSALGAWIDKVSDPESRWNADADWLSDYALYLLAQFREPRAYPFYLRLCRLPEADSDYWLGDILTNDMQAFLASTCNGDLESLKALVSDPSIYEWARWTAMDALIIVAMQGDTPPAELADWLVQAAATQAREPDNPFWTFTANAQYDLAEPALMPLLQKAYADGLIDNHDVALADLETTIRLDPAGHRQAAQRGNDYLRDAGAAMHWVIGSRNRHETDSENFDFPDPSRMPQLRTEPKIGRNESCPCGSGKKYKKCCLNAEPYADA